MSRIAACALLLAALAVSGCSLEANQGSGGSGGAGGQSIVAPPPSSTRAHEDRPTPQPLAFPIVATRNTTRVAGDDPVADAAGVAVALFPATESTTRPPAVVLADKDDWQGIVAAGVLSSAPLHAPILLSDGDSLPPVTQKTLDRLKPKGVTLTKGAQAIRIGGTTPAPDKLKSAVIKGGDPYSKAVAIDRFASIVRGKPSPDVVIASGERPQYAMPAAAWAARSGDPVLFTRRNSLPSATAKALGQHEKPRIFVLGPPSVISDAVVKQLSQLGRVERIDGKTPVDNAIAFATYKRGGFGWGAAVPGQNLTIANQSRPGDAAAAAGLGANGIFAPLLLTDRAQPLARALEGYLLDIEPGFEGGDPSQGVYNHAWILGGADAVSPEAQDRIDAATALVPVDQPRK